ncbi:MAG: 4Fe-4S dicluster domain-containing protein [Bacillota bacterium]
MERVELSKNRIGEFLGCLKSSCRVVAPVKNDGLLEFKEIESPDQVQLTDELPYKSPKEYLFPQVEKILSFSPDGEARNESKPRKTVIFGVKPCDLEALRVLTTVFTKGDYVDTIYKGHLDNTVFIGMGCAGEKPGCFCGERGIDRNSSTQCDIFLEDRGDCYLAAVITPAGRSVMDGFMPGAGGQGTGLIENMAGAAQAVDNKLLELDMDENEIFNIAVWDTASETCLGCGACTYICPTCHCFGFRDTTAKGEANRYRCWDSCMYPKFTLHASGHNPRPTRKERFRQRVMHKYVYIRRNFGLTACTGCGRCVRSCPAGINIRSVVKSIKQEVLK